MRYISSPASLSSGKVFFYTYLTSTYPWIRFSVDGDDNTTKKAETYASRLQAALLQDKGQTVALEDQVREDALSSG